MTPCPHCGAATTTGAPFCGSCGRPVQTSAPDPSATQVRPSTPPAGSGPVDPSAAQTQHAPQGQPAQQWGQQPPAGQAPQQWGQQPPSGQAPQQWGQPGAAAHQPPAQQWGQPQQQWGQQPTGAYAPQGGAPYAGTPGKPNINFAALLTGNWIGSAMVAGAALGVAFVVSLIVAFAGSEDLDVASAIAMTFLLTGATFGPDLRIDLGNDTMQSIGQYPTLATVLALGVAVFMFQRITAGHRDIRPALADAARIGVIIGAVLTVLAIVMTAVKPEIEGYNQAGSGLFFAVGETGLSVLGAIFLPFLVTFTVLGLSTLVRSQWMQGRLAVVHAWISAPLYGLAALVVLFLGAGVFYLIANIAGDDDSRSFDAIVGQLSILPSLGLFMVGLGVWSQLGSTTKSDGDSDKSYDRLVDFADDQGALFWISPVVAIAVAAALVFVVVRKSHDRTKVQRNVLVLLGTLLVALPLMVRFANAHTKFWNDDTDSSGTAGVDGFQTTLLFIVLTAIVGAVVLVVTGNLDVNAVKAKAQNAAAQAQQQWQQQQAAHQAAQQQNQQWGQQPGQAPQQWGAPGQPGQAPQQQWGQQPPQAPQQWGQQPPQAPQQQWGAPGQPGQPGQPPQQWGQPQQPGQPDNPGEPQWGQQPPPQGQGWGQQPPQQ